ncbi:MAG: hypothetical protein A2213_12980 [Lysobacterales bacterium RIFOXYA1_FULL_68_6]|nr:MAG: hypothetical protein A2213_12980 [Xanthomonadales bacterium RIFOXYA1_FULL_68_6]
MAGDQQTATEGAQAIFQPLASRPIEMIGRLVQHQHIRRMQQSGGESQQDRFTPTERRNLAMERQVVEAQAIQLLGNAFTQVPVAVRARQLRHIRCAF